MDLSDVCIYIITRNRPDLILRSLKSVQNQNYANYSIVVSDNSTNEETESVVNNILKDDPRITYVRRIPQFPSFMEHINGIISSNKHEFFVIFHDDDEMLPNYLSDTLKYFGDKDVCAVAGNAYYKYGNKVSKRKFRNDKSVVVFREFDGILSRYSFGGISPLPVYMYRKSKIQGALFEKEHGGIYSDVAFVCNLTKYGKVLYIPDIVMNYFISPSQISQHHDYLQYLSLIKYLRERNSNRKLLIPLRIFNMYSQASLIMQSTREPYYKTQLLKLFCKYSQYNYFPKYIIRILQSKFYA